MKEKIYIPIKIDEIVVSNEITKEIENSKDKKALLEIVGVDFTSINIEKQEEVLIQINKLLKKYKIWGIKITSTPDSIDKKQLKIVKKI